jgi:hypothetical protein
MYIIYITTPQFVRLIVSGGGNVIEGGNFAEVGICPSLPQRGEYKGSVISYLIGTLGETYKKMWRSHGFTVSL